MLQQGKRQHLTACTWMLLFHISLNHQQKCCCFARSHWSTNGLIFTFSSCFSSRHQTGQVRKRDSSDTMKMDPSYSLCYIFFPHLPLMEHSTALHLVQVIANSIKVTNKTIFTRDCLISGHYKQQLRFEWSDFFVSVILDEVLMCALSHWVGQLRLLRVMRLMCAH